MLDLNYNLLGAGWAHATISNEKKSLVATVSYLHDALGHLAESTLYMINGGVEAHVVFMDEPGEHQLIFSMIDSFEFQYEVLWYED